MARKKRNASINDISGHIGKQIVFKQYGDKTVVTAYPDMSKVKPSKAQKVKRSLFKEAVVYAKNIIGDPGLKKKYLKKVKAGKSVYHYALQEYMKKNK